MEVLDLEEGLSGHTVEVSELVGLEDLTQVLELVCVVNDDERLQFVVLDQVLLDFEQKALVRPTWDNMAIENWVDTVHNFVLAAELEDR